jgi:predicted permease
MLTRFIAYVKGLVRRGRAHRELDEELQYHVERETDANIRRGMTPHEARRIALRDLGGVTQTREAVADVRSTWLDSFRQDVVYAMRGFRRSPGFTFVALVVLAFGIAANTTVFSVINAVLLKPLPVAQPDELRFFSVMFPGLPIKAHLGAPYGTFRQIAQHGDVFSGVAAFATDSAKLGNGTNTSRIVGERVSTGYFDVLGVGAAIGRTLVAADDAPEADPVVVISDRFWRTKLDADPNVLGRTLDFRAPQTYGGVYLRYHRAYTIVGVMPREFKGISTVWVPADYWVPLRQRARDRVAHRAESSGGYSDASRTVVMEQELQATLVARPLPGVSEATVRGVIQAAEREMPETAWATAKGDRKERGVIVMDRSDDGRLPFDPSGKVVPERLAIALMIVPLLVVTIAATNLAGILMARGLARRGEIAIRLALGAGRMRVARQMLTESVLLSLAGTLMALALSRAFVKMFTSYMPRFAGPFNLTALSLDVPLDVRVLFFTVALGIGTGVFVGMTPALQALRTDILGPLAGAANAIAASPRARFGRWIVVPQICLSVVLLLAAGVLIRTLLRAEFGDRGFDPDGVIYADLYRPSRYSSAMTPEQRRAENARQKAEYLQLLDEVRGLPGIEVAALTNHVLWTNSDNVPVVTRETVRDRQYQWAAGAEVSNGYFEAMRIPIVRGRAFGVGDTASSEPVAIVCERLARALWPDKDALGEFVAVPEPGPKAPPPKTWYRIIGIARAIKMAGDEAGSRSFLFRPIEQQPTLLSPSILARGRANAPELMKALPAAIVAAQPDAEVPRARTMNETIADMLYPQRLGAIVLGIAGGFGLLLSIVGLYGVVSYAAARRMRELGIRAALGAERHDLVVLLLRDAVSSLAIAIAAGMALGFAAVRLVSTVVVALPRPDAVTLLTIPLLLSTVILAACLRPVRRAARVNPIDVLRAL